MAEKEIRVLILEDQQDDRELIKQALSREGLTFTATYADNRDDFLKALEEFKPDLILSDYSLPSFDGLSALDIVRRKSETIPFLLVSGIMGEGTAIESLRRGATDYVFKDRIAGLGPAVRRALEEAAQLRTADAMFQAVSRKEKFSQALLQNVQEIVAVVNASGTIIYVNSALETSLGYSPSEATGRNLAEFLDPKESPRALRALSLLASSGARRSGATMELIARHSNGSKRDLECEVNNLLDYKPVAGIVCCCRDITQRKRAQREKDRLEAEVARFQKMEAAGEVAGGVAHDFNNMLMVIQGESQQALEKLSPDDPAREHLREINGVAGRAGALSRQLLLFARRQPMKLSPVDLNVLLKDMEHVFVSIARKPISLSVIADARRPVIKCDVANLRQAITNLVVNARDAMPSGGVLTLHTADAEIDSEYCRKVRGASPGRYVRLSVEDTGAGMTPGVLRRCFEPYFTTKKNGTGLGLAVSYGIVRHHGGWITAESKPGRGSQFRMYFPVRGPAPRKQSKTRTAKEIQ